MQRRRRRCRSEIRLEGRGAPGDRPGRRRRTGTMGETGGAWDGARIRRCIGMTGLAFALAAMLAAALTSGAPDVLAQADALAPGTIVHVANTGGQPLNLRAGPSTEQTVLTRLAVGELLTVTGTPSITGPLRWLPVRTGGGLAGWVAADFVATS